MDKKNIDNEFQKHLEYWLPEIDKFLINKRVPISERPYRAAIVFIDEAVADIKNSTKDEMKKPPWFRYWYDNVKYWYACQYGDAIKTQKKDILKSFTVIQNIPFEIQVPTKLNEHVSEQESWLIFPNEVFENEEPIDWIENCPPKRILKDEFEKVISDVKLKGTFLRNLWVNSLIKIGDEQQDSLLDNIMEHLQAISDNILHNYNKGVSIAIWDLCFVVEKAIKAYLINKGATLIYVHDVRKLFMRMMEIDKHDFEFVKIELFPKEKKALKYRYGELRESEIGYLDELYIESLKILNIVMNGIEKKYKMNNARFLLKNPYYPGR